MSSVHQKESYELESARQNKNQDILIQKYLLCLYCSTELKKENHENQVVLDFSHVSLPKCADKSINTTVS